MAVFFRHKNTPAVRENKSNALRHPPKGDSSAALWKNRTLAKEA
jgi:hypothetical protein